MPRSHTTPRRGVRTTLAAVCAAALLLTGGCGDIEPEPESDAGQVEACRAQWRDVGLTIADKDLDEHPSAMSQRWSTIMAGVEYYRVNAGKECVLAIEQQVQAIAALRTFSDRLQPYDMEYQRDQASSAIALYLSDPLPGPTRDDNGKVVRPPRKKPVRAAMRVLEENAAAANEELMPAWTQATSIDLDDEEEVTRALADLDRLSSSSAAFQACEQALQVVVAALRAQQGAS